MHFNPINQVTDFFKLPAVDIIKITGYPAVNIHHSDDLTVAVSQWYYDF
jgi:hypothetical protein